jgi:serine/threonine protein kinase
VTRAAAEVGSTANSYEILAKIAEGGMAEIFLARGASAGGVARHVVLKKVLRDRASDPNFIRMFLDEARLAAQLQHPNVAQVYDIGKLGDSYFFTMEYVHGETVRAMLQRASALKKPIPLGCVLTIAAGAAAGLHHAHDRIGIDRRPLGIVHRDVSPSNLMVGYEGHVKLVDFGVAKAADRLQETRSGTVKGKISYMSPEQCRGQSLDRRSDLFSLGIVLWEMLTTERLFRRSSDFEAMAAIVGEAPVRPSSKRSEIPTELDDAVMRLLAKDPADRFQTGDDLLATLEEIAGRSGSVMSAGTLARAMKDLFGPRPEPWVEFDEQDQKVVTVTSEPIPSELRMPLPDEISLQLAGVADLRSPMGRAEPTRSLAAGSSPGSSSARPTVQQRTVGVPTEPSPVAPLPGPPTDLMDAVDVDAIFDREFDTARQTESRPVAPPMPAGYQAEAEPSSATTPATRQSSPRIDPAAVAAAMMPAIVPTPMPAIAPTPMALPVVAIDEPAPALRKRPPLALIGGGVAIVLAIVIVIVMSRGGGDEPARSAAATPADAATPVARPAIVDTAAPPAVAPATPDAAAIVTPPPPAADPGADLARAMTAGRFGDAVTACSAGAASVSANAITCAIAACRARDVAKARTWAQGVPAGKRGPITAACAKSKIALDPPRTKPTKPAKVDRDCAKNPLDCQR